MPIKMAGKGLQRVTSRVRYVTDPDRGGLGQKFSPGTVATPAHITTTPLTDMRIHLHLCTDGEII